MRNLFATGLFLFSLATISVAPTAFAQEPISETMMRFRPAPELRDSRSQQLVQERAARKAQYRTARRETRLWLGQPTLRPVMGSGTNAGSMFQHWDYNGGAIQNGYWGYYGAPTGF